jgi:hypothetical protein
MDDTFTFSVLLAFFAFVLAMFLGKEKIALAILKGLFRNKK